MIFNENGEILNESFFKSKLKEDFEKKPERDLSEFTKVGLDQYIKTEYNGFKKFLNAITLGVAILCTPRIKNMASGVGGCIEEYSDRVDGCAYYDGKSVVAVIMILTTGNGEKIIDYIEIAKKYRGMGLSKQLMDEAVNTFGGTILNVDLDNQIAINIYKKYGFEPFNMWNNCMSMRLPRIIKRVNIQDCDERKISFNEAYQIAEKNFANWGLSDKGYHYLYSRGQDLFIIDKSAERFTIVPLSYSLDLSYITDASKKAIELGARYTVIPIKDTVTPEFYEKAGLHRENADKISVKYTL